MPSTRFTPTPSHQSRAALTRYVAPRWPGQARGPMTARPARVNRSHALRAFSLLETTIAISILGIGLIMVASIFPVALTQHQDNVDQSRAFEVTRKAEALLRAKLNPALLWAEPEVRNLGIDAPWRVLPFANIIVGAGVEPDAYGICEYTDFLNSAPLYSGVPNYRLVGRDLWSDRIAPISDDEANAVPNRIAWYGFYRVLGNGSVQYAAAVCKAQRFERHLIQNVQDDLPSAFLNTTSLYSSDRRLPSPWRVSVGYNQSTGRLFNIRPELESEGLGELAPTGSKIMITGAAWLMTDPPTSFRYPLPAGRILTVSAIFDNTDDRNDNPETIEVLEDLSDLPDFGATNILLDVWVFPPKAIRYGNIDDPSYLFDRTSPVLDWKVFL